MSNFLSHVNLNKNELRNAVIQNLATAPSSPVAGQIYYDTVTFTIYQYNGNTSAWVPLDASKLSGAIPNTALTTNPLARANHTGSQTSSTISDLATVVKAYRLDEFAVPNTDVSMASHKITNLTDPSSNQDAATKKYVDDAVVAAASGIDAKAAVLCVAVSNITLSGTQTIDGVSVIAGDRVLVKGQSTGSQNGTYLVAAGAWTRTTDASATGEINPGTFWFVEQGTTYAGSSWIVQNTGAITLGSTAIIINQFGAATVYTNGNGLSLAGNSFSVLADPVSGGGISVTGSGVKVDTAVVVRKYSTTFGDGSNSVYTITHNLGTLDVQVTVRDVATNTHSYVDIISATTNTITLTFAQIIATNTYRVTVFG